MVRCPRVREGATKGDAIQVPVHPSQVAMAVLSSRQISSSLARRRGRGDPPGGESPGGCRIAARSRGGGYAVTVTVTGATPATATKGVFAVHCPAAAAKLAIAVFPSAAW
jgi:hypothetical protein